MLTQKEFLDGLGLSYPTFSKYRWAGIFKDTPKVGQRGVFTQEYLDECRKALATYRESQKKR